MFPDTDQPAPEVNEQVPVNEPQTPDAPPQEEGQDPAAPPQLSEEELELNFLGSDKFKLHPETPEEVRKALKTLESSLNKGWTQKNQALAEQRKQLEAAQQQITQYQQTALGEIKELAKLESLQNAISQYNNVDWSAWLDQDPVAAQKALANLQVIKTQKEELSNELSAKRQQAMSVQQQQAAAYMQQAAERLSNRVKDWSETKRNDLTKFVQSEYLNTGTPVDGNAFQAMNWHPGLVEMANDAYLYRQSLKQAAAAKPATPVTPVPKVGGASPSAKDPEKMTTDEWFKWREKELAAQRSARNLKPANKR